ncbi:MAG: VWA domain-containing protein [Lachnospiraceae bacterium]|nr:VWA domain-containing protein [Lachnospiraceae bacterium]
MKRLKFLSALLITAVLFLGLSLFAFAEETENVVSTEAVSAEAADTAVSEETSANDEEQEEYEPIDVVFVLDISGSMATSDPEYNVIKAVRMFVNMMPTQDCRVAVVCFNDEAATYTTKDGEPSYYSLDDLSAITYLHTVLSTIEYDRSRDTAIGFGLEEAVSLMSANMREDCQTAILLFSDGVDDLDSEIQYQECQEALADAVVWASQNDCYIYSIGFNYQLADGTGSLGTEGLEKLTNISESTGGYLTVVETLDEIETVFNDVLATICKVKPIVVEVPGDGGYYEIPVEVTGGVIEMNLRIACNTEEALQSGTLLLKDPEGNEYSFADHTDTSYYDEEEDAISMKVVGPEIGEWTLVLDGIVGDSIDIRMMNHYNISIDAYATVPSGNPTNTAYINDTVQIVCTLLDSTGSNADASLYNLVTSATATVVPRGEGESPQEVILSYTDGVLKGSYIASGQSICDITVTVESDYFTKTAAFEVENGNRAFVMNGTLENQEIRVKKSASIDNIYSIVSDEEGDEITASITSVSDGNVASVRVEGDSIVIDALKWGSTTVTVQYTDAQGNTNSTMFSVKVKDPVRVLLLSLIPVIIAIIVLIVVLVFLNRSRRIRGSFKIGPVTMKSGTETAVIGRTVSMDAKVLFKGGKNMKKVLNKYGIKAKAMVSVNDMQRAMVDKVLVKASSNSPLSKELSKITFKGTFFGKNGFILLIPASQAIELGGKACTKKVKKAVKNSQELNFKVATADGNSVSFTINYEKPKR